ncbi:MAG: hypothetical protein ACTHJR_05565 [Sphingomonas sp.]|uniref:hypothetical protein n=1 Tax=Sphingomonas sp. TaxID=28214 RepID=UPI003F7F31D7
MEHADALPAIVDFLRRVGIAVDCASLPEDGFLPAIAVREGRLLYDPDRLQWPGDLLHEAGHISVTDPAQRPTVESFDSDGGDEMAAIAWSYAAALAAGIDPRVVFHDHGYRNGGETIAENFAAGRYIGVPMLQYYGLARRPADGGEQYPAMIKWLR